MSKNALFKKALKLINPMSQSSLFSKADEILPNFEKFVKTFGRTLVSFRNKYQELSLKSDSNYIKLF
ncbi:MAG: hypothetical protein C6H99_05180 [Epsilonproteobacteria bacterium]|nr:hypothetical protein [Campylobacterota bacterium]